MCQVSLLIPVYGVEAFIERCARSLFEQTYDKIEYIFVDDCTKDSSLEILHRVLEEYPQRKPSVKVIHHRVNRGLAAARNTAMEHSTGRYIMHVDSDDYLELNAVELLYQCAIQNDAEVVVGNYKIVGQGRAITVPLNIPKDNVQYVIKILYKECSPSIWGKLFLRDFYLKTGVHSVEGLNQGEDYVVVPRLIYYAHRVVTLDIPLYNYVQCNSNSYTNNVTDKSIQDMLKADDILEQFFLTKPDGNAYKQAMGIARLRSETYFLKISPISSYKKILDAYAGFNHKQVYLLPVGDRLILMLAQKNYFRLLRIVVVVGFGLRKIIYRIIKRK